LLRSRKSASLIDRQALEAPLERAEMPLIRVKGLHFSYKAGTQQPIPALCGVDLTVHAGEHLALIGPNGSGKSTLLRHLNALVVPSAGDVWVNGMNTRERQHLRDIRSTVGMVFQSPDSQIVATVVEEDVAFGPENLGLPRSEIVRRIDWALESTGLTHLRNRPSHLLSGGQKQRLAIASALAMRPRCLLLDEATAMLDPLGRDEVHQAIQRLLRDGITIVSVTHRVSEVLNADRVLVMNDGRVVLSGDPAGVFGRPDLLRDLRIQPPLATVVAQRVADRIPGFRTAILTAEDLLGAVRDRTASFSGELQ
jgi:energy-coupling factor transporter ATPase